jgi:hypothetical protein
MHVTQNDPATNNGFGSMGSPLRESSDRFNDSRRRSRCLLHFQESTTNWQRHIGPAGALKDPAPG